MNSIKSVVQVVLLLACCSSAFSATRVYDENGLIVGATGIDVGSVFYDVTFKPGTCNALFNNCDPAEFAFSSLQASDAASKALSIQVFNTIIPSVATIAGCGTYIYCSFATPYERTGTTIKASTLSVYSQYYYPNSYGQLYAGTTSPLGRDGSLYAIWTPVPVPVPGAAWFFGSGLMGLIAAVRRHNVFRQGKLPT